MQTLTTRHNPYRNATLAVWRWLALLLALLCVPSALALEASVDRALVTEGDSLTLTIRQNQRNSDDEPDYLPLETDFHLFGSRQSSRSIVSNSRVEAWTEWQITLVPKRSGQLTIPAITVGNARTAPIRIDVQPPQPTTSTGEQRDPVFIEVAIDRERVYVEQQLLLTVRVFHALALEDMQLSDPEPEHTRVDKVAQNNFRRDIDGVTYQVHELVYAIFAEQPGELVIPELVFSGRQPLRPRSFFDFPGQGRALRRLSRPLTVEVKPIPSQFSGTVWLPASNLTLVESWSGNPNQLTVGESMTRSLTLQADGIDASRLPELAQPQIDGGRLYADQPQLDNNSDATGMHGKRVQSAALIPSRAGPLSLPETKVIWWDVDSDSEQVATISPHQLQIRAAAQGTQPQAAASPTAPNNDRSANTVYVDDSKLLGWQIAAALLACGWAATLLWMWRRRSPLQPTEPAETASYDIREPEAFKQLQQACRQQQPAAARDALLKWGAAITQREQIGLHELQRWAGEKEFSDAVDDLEQRLYGTSTGDWRSDALLAAIGSLRHRQRKTREGSAASAALPSLYPSN